MNKLFRAITITLLLTAIILAAFSCESDGNQGGGESSDTTVANTETDTANTETDTAVTLDLPSTLNFNGEDVTFLVVDNSFEFYTSKEIFAETLNGELFNDSVYGRNLQIEELLNINIKEIRSRNAVTDASQSLTAGDTEYDIVMPYMNDTIKLAQSGLLYDLNSINYLDLDKPWWDQRANANLSINGKIFMTTGDISILDNECTMVMFFNKKLISDYKLEIPYDLVRNNQWTLDKVFAMSEVVTEDINGDGALNQNDQWGLSVAGNAPHSMYFSSGERMSAVIDGEMQIVMNNERAVTIIDKILELVLNPKILAAATGDTSYDTVNKMFNESRVMIVTFALVDINGLRDAEFEFGILPYPLYSETQESYNNLISTGLVPSTSVPYNSRNTDKVGAVLEAMAYYSVDTLTEAYYDNALKLRYARDDESGEMLDIIFATRVYDMAYIYNWGGIGSLIESIYSSKKTGFASVYAAKEPAILAAMQETIDLFDNIR
jgi:ABC-type glycerol-3-phosphate transport system substrate-binding protein